MRISDWSSDVCSSDLPTLFAGGRVVILEGFEEEAVVRLLEARRIDTFFAVPTVYQALLDHPRFATTPLDHVRHWGCGGAPLPDAVVERYRSLGVDRKSTRLNSSH